MPNQKFSPTSEQRVQVRDLSARGLTLAQIGSVLGIRSEKTLVRYFPKELAEGRLVSRISVFGAQYKLAISGKHPHATISFLKRLAHWSEDMEIDRIRGSGKGTEVLVAEIRRSAPPRRPDQELAEPKRQEEVIEGPWGPTEETEE